MSRIIIDATNKTIDMIVTDEEIQRRRGEWKARPFKHSRGVLYRYARDVADASHGAYTD